MVDQNLKPFSYSLLIHLLSRQHDQNVFTGSRLLLIYQI